MLPTKDNPDLAQYRSDFPAGHTVFTEGDDAPDVYILGEGSLEVLKGNHVIATIATPGTLFGEMSFFLSTTRTSTVRTRTKVSAYRIPCDRIAALFQEFPDLALTCIRTLAERLDTASRVLFGLKELCEQIPEAVLITDHNGTLLSWNSVAEDLYGESLAAQEGAATDRFYAEPESYHAYLRDVQEQHMVRERVFTLRRADGTVRYVSVSATILYDGHHAVKGVLNLCRDVTQQQQLEQRYQRIRRWLVVPLLIAALLGAAVWYGYPFFTRGRAAEDFLHRQLHSRLARDYAVLQSLLAEPLSQRTMTSVQPVLHDFCRLQQGDPALYRGILVLDADKKVIAASAPQGNAVGDSYAGIEFPAAHGSVHRVLTVYRADAAHPMGAAQTEVAFPLTLTRAERFWLVLQMDMQTLRDVYTADAATLRQFRFQQ